MPIHGGRVIMHVLSRRQNELVVINDHVTVTIVEIQDAKLQRGDTPPPQVKSDPHEVEEQIRRPGQPSDHP
jgi:sRNA-binding carbon storage regulator CsrA